MSQEEDYLLDQGEFAEETCEIEYIPLPFLEQVYDRDQLVLDSQREWQVRTILTWMQTMNSRTPSQPHFYLRGREMVRLVEDDRTLIIEPFTTPILRSHLEEFIDFQKEVVKDKEVVFTTSTNLAAMTCENILKRRALPFTQLKEVLSHPVFTPEGIMTQETQYYQDIAAYVDTRCLEYNVPEKPTKEMMEAAKDFLADELLHDFPFAEEASKAHAMAYGFLPFIRRMIDGPTPPHLVTATVERTGKSLLIECIGQAALGKMPPMMTEKKQNEEWAKEITAFLVKNPSMVCIDNVNRRLDSSALAALFTQTTWRQRKLGTNDVEIAVPNNAAWSITANNPQVSPELLKRCCWIHLDAMDDSPETREKSTFKHHPIMPWIKANQAELMSAFLTCIQYWIVEGAPRSQTTLGGFAEWAMTMGGLLECLGIPGFLGNAESLKERADTRGQEWRAFVSSWWEDRQEFKTQAGHLRDIALERELLIGTLGDGSPASQSKRLASSLGTQLDKHFPIEYEERSFRVAVRTEFNSHRKSKDWFLERIRVEGEPDIEERQPTPEQEQEQAPAFEQEPLL